MLEQLLTVDGARAALVAAIEARGDDYNYREEHPGVACEYVVHGTNEPGCLVGYAGWVVGGDEGLHALHMQEGSAAVYAISGALGLEPNWTALDESNIALRALQGAQSQQDSGHTWGAALEEFDKTVTRLRYEAANMPQTLEDISV